MEFQVVELTMKPAEARFYSIIVCAAMIVSDSFVCTAMIVNNNIVCTIMIVSNNINCVAIIVNSMLIINIYYDEEQATFPLNFFFLFI